jgi:tRNA-2-methylthio-N6-dimethylallyladenosine synthase
MNINDSEKMAGILVEKGYMPAKTEEEADIFIVNTCSVREKAKEKLFSYLGRLKKFKQKKGVKIIVAGCVAQLEKESIKKRAPYVDILIGTNSYFKLKDIIGKRDYSDFQFYRDWKEIDSKPVRRQNFSAYITIMEGCDSFCTYCVVPFSRGRERSRPMSLILKEVELLEKEGYKEVQLLGQNVDAYIDPETGGKLDKLLEKIAIKSRIPWIRFLTSHPAKFSIEIIKIMKDYSSILKALHLPFQAGGDKILKLMNRGYTRSDYLKLIDSIKTIIPDIALSTDIIVGFPEETDKDYEQTVEILKYVEYENIFSFKYSPRPRTKAFDYGDNIPDSVKTERLIKIQEIQKEIQLKNNKKKIGKILRVLTEVKNRRDESQLVGRIESGRIVNIQGANRIGEFYDVLIEEIGPHNLKGRVVNAKEN